ncbi:copper amine oxidase-like protein [Paenibacillus cellulosilyticus]|uniref:Copper amine oxidase-like protein n=1 Tax=Paenibacillus cellulosilyticus TaxID=375489 RepID=A0A2V2YZE0_9BACL|nr:stalk domain-containing protein [Paenibacillus cellulosilyticus]PWW08469.1 copper amine oxidase-like protein [Paenibacillus cellulosilyticus]QKS48054.1 copper amine oxidase N-terminal domain-containing protein [Paenibacillus cellulosilyticus]
MKFKWQTIWLAVLALTLMLPAAAQAQAQPTSNKSVKVQTSAFELVFDGKTVVLPEGQFIFVNQGTSYVPVRFISYALQKTVAWDSKTKKVTVSEPSDKERIVLQEYLMNAAGKSGQSSSVGGKAITAAPVSASFVFDGTSRTLPTGQTAYMVNNTIYVPVRFMSESIGTEIKWDSATHRISGESQEYRQQQQANSNTDSNTDQETGTGSDNENGTEAGTSSGTEGTGAVSGGGVSAVKPTYEQIKADADTKLQSLYNTAKSRFASLALQYFSTEDEATKQKLKAQGEAYLAQVTSQFNTIIAQTEAKLTENGYDTAIIQEYRTRFESEMAEGQKQLESMMS